MHFFARAMGARHSSLLPARQLNMGYNHSKNLHRIGGTNQSFFAEGYDKALDLAVAILGKGIFYLEKCTCKSSHVLFIKLIIFFVIYCKVANRSMSLLVTFPGW